MNIVTVKWGSKYTSHDVNILYKSIDKSIYDRFYCYTEDANGLDSGIVPIEIDEDLEGVWNKLALFKLNLGKTLYLDIDIVIQNDINKLLDHDSFTMIKCYWKPLREVIKHVNHINHNINSSIMLWSGKENIDIWNKFIQDPEYYMLIYHGIDHFIYHEGFTSRYWPRGLIYSRKYGIDARDGWYQPGNNWFKKDAIVCLMNGPTTKQDYIELENDINK